MPAAALLATKLALAAPAGAIISNQASLVYEPVPGVQSVALSNEVRLVTGVVRSPSAIEFTRLTAAGSGSFQEPVGPAACLQSGSFVMLADPIVGGTTIDPAQARDVAAAGSYNLGEMLFVRLADTDQNADFAAIDYAVVTVNHVAGGDSETIRLTETGPDTGVFAGYVPSANALAGPADCVLQGVPGTDVRVTYTDPVDAADSSSARAALDPLGVVFDSLTGMPVDGATVELVDAVTGQPATVYGNDGVSAFPSTITSGSAVTDSGGTTYAFANGEYRFPVVPAGEYRLLVTPPPTFAAPSSAAIADLQALPNAPFSLAPASFGGSFTIDGNGPFGYDYPIDPQSTSLFLRKSTTTTIAAPGDFVRYEIVVENAAAINPANAVRVIDRLPGAVRYVPGSAKLDGSSIDDPAVDGGAMQLEFTLGNLAAGQRAAITYVVEVIGGGSNEEIVNTAIAEAESGLVSNQSEARIRVTEDLFRSTSTLIGRVVEGDCNAGTFAEDRGVSGVRIYLEDGRYAVSDDGGRFHFEGLPPGTHVAQMDTASIPEHFDVRGCAEQGRFAGRGDSQFVDLTRGSLQRADFYLRRKAVAEGRVDIELTNSGTGDDQEVAYEVSLRGQGNIAIGNPKVIVLLPDGVSFVPGSARLDGGSAPAPRVVGQSVSFSLDDQAGDWRRKIRFTGVIVADVTGELRAKALARFSSPGEDQQQTPIAEAVMVRESAVSENEGYVLNLTFDTLSAELSLQDRLELDRLIDSWKGVNDIRISATGHSDATSISAASRRIFTDNYILSRARALAAASYVASALQVPQENIQIEGRGPDEPIATNDTGNGRRQNRRVEMVLSGQRPARQAFLRVTQPSSGTLIAETRGLLPGAEMSAEQMRREKLMQEHLLPQPQVEPHVNSLRPGIAWVSPQGDFSPSIPAIRVAIAHAPNQKVMLSVNGVPVNPLNFDGIEVNTARTVNLSRWAGVDLVEGPNRLVADVMGPDGVVVERLEHSVHYAGPAVRGELLEDRSTLVADGRMRPVLAIRFYDRFGEPARHASVGAFSVSQPYRSWWQVQNDRANKLVTIGSHEPLYTIGRDGIAYLELEPTTESGMATVSLKFENRRELEVSSYLKPAPRDWILVGFGEGTAGYNTLRDNQVAALDAGQEDGYYDEGRVAFFAKGQVKGEYLLTMAYDSARDRDESRERFLTNIDPNQYYTLYADNTEQRFEAPSQRKLYVKLERNQFMAMFGDFSTGLTMTDLTRYERRFNGLKSEYHGRNVDYSVFATETDQSFVRDELQGDGTSGLYRLSRSPIIGNSETVRIEVRDRFDSARVLSSQTLNRFLDYNLDNFDGTLFFKKPVPSRDQDFNPVYIVVEYESRAAANDDVIAGGRVSVGTRDDAIQVGLSRIEEGQQGAGGDLTGMDLRWQVGEGTLVRAELAESNAEVGGGDLSGRARAVSVDHRSDRLDLRAYHKAVDQDFGLGQRSTAEKGISKIGVDGRFAIMDTLTLNAQASKQENLETGTERLVAEAEVRYQDDVTGASVGIAHASDEFTDGVKQVSDVATVSVSRRLMGSKVKVRAGGNLGIGDETANTDYPANYVFGMDYEVASGVDVFAEYESAEGRDIDAEMTRVGVRASPWNRAQFNSSMTNEMSEYGPRLFANLGLIQGFQVNERWVIDIGLDQTRTLSDPGLREFDPDREFASGSKREDFIATSFGTLYQSDTWSVNSRLEYRDADSEQRTTLVSGWYREPTTGHGLSAGLAVMQSERADSSATLSANLRFGWAWRVAESSWSFLDRIDLIFDDETLAGDDQRSWRLVNNLNANRRISARSQLALQYAFKYVQSEFDAESYRGYTDVVGFDLSRGFAAKWEAGLHASVYHAWASSVTDYGAGVDLGFNVRDNLWVTLGYNVAGFHDADLAEARYTAQGPYLRLSIKADQESLKRIAGR